MGGSWKSYDILIDGMSLPQNHRTSFMNEVVRASQDQLIDRLSQHNASEMKEPIERGPHAP